MPVVSCRGLNWRAEHADETAEEGSPSIVAIRGAAGDEDTYCKEREVGEEIRVNLDEAKCGGDQESLCPDFVRGGGADESHGYRL